MKTSHIKLFFSPYLLDRKYELVVFVLIICIGCGLFLFEYDRSPQSVHLGTMWYFVILSIFTAIGWLIINFVPLLPYYQHLYAALHTNNRLEAVYLVDEERTQEQKMVKELLLSLHNTYETKLNEFKQQQEIKHQFTLQWVHQMKTPLAIIDMQIQQAKHTPLIGSILEEAHRLEQGLNMMLHTARLDKFEIDLQVRHIHLHQLARDVINSYKKMCIQYYIYPKVVGEAAVESDSKWLSFVLQQLVGNAIKYSKQKEGSKSLTIEIKSSGHETELYIIDEGIGIEPTDIRRVYEPFYTGHNGRISGESTGMGLYLCKQICQRLGHQLEITSEKGVGTTAKLVFSSQGIHSWRA